MERTNRLACTMSIQNFTDNVKGLARKSALILATAFASLSCGGNDNPKPGPGTEPGGTDPTVGKVYDFQGRGSGARVYTQDSLIAFYADGAAFIVSFRKADLKKGNNVMVKTQLFDNVEFVTNGIARLANYSLDTEISPKDREFLGTSTSSNDQLKKATVKTMGIVSVRRTADDGNWASIKYEEFVAIAKLVNEGPAAMLGDQASVAGQIFKLDY